MRDDVKVCVSARVDFFSKYYDIPQSVQTEVDAFISDSSITCLGVKEDFYGLNYSATRDVKNITAEKMSANGDGAVLNVEYKNGDKETITFRTVDVYDYGFGDYEGYAMTDNGILYYSVYADYDGDEVVGYDCYTLGYDFYVDKATTPEPEKPTEPSEPTEPSTTTEPTETTITTDPVVIGILGDADEDGKVNIKDATAIQKHIANLITLTDTGKHLADVDGNSNVNIKDATAIQKHIAGMDTGFAIGQPV